MRDPTGAKQRVRGPAGAWTLLSPIPDGNYCDRPLSHRTLFIEHSHEAANLRAAEGLAFDRRSSRSFQMLQTFSQDVDAHATGLHRCGGGHVQCGARMALQEDRKSLNCRRQRDTGRNCPTVAGNQAPFHGCWQPSKSLSSHQCVFPASAGVRSFRDSSCLLRQYRPRRVCHDAYRGVDRTFCSVAQKPELASAFSAAFLWRRPIPCARPPAPRRPHSRPRPTLDPQSPSQPCSREVRAGVPTCGSASAP